MFSSSTLLALAGASTALAGEVLWDGRFNASTATDLSAWSWSNAVGAYQYYIHGTSDDLTSYVNIASDFKNPADSGSADGVKITLDDTSYWEGQTMRRTELIPQTSAAINAGKVYYHFSIQHTATNPPTQTEEHQLAFFESHFTELKSGALSGSTGTSNALHWMVGGESQWNISDWTAGVWHNVAYGIDFDAQTVEFYHSTDAADLSLIAGPVSASASSNGADWHVGALRLPGSTDTAGTEDFYFSGVYVESGDVTLSVAGPDGAAVAASSASASSTAAASTAVASSSTAAAATSSSSTAAATTTASSTAAAAVTTTAAAVSSTSSAPTTLQTVVKPSSSSSSSVAASTTSEVAPASTSAPADDEGDCAVEYVYV